MNIILMLIYMLVFPGILFLIFYALFCEWVDRKLYAKMQNRIGPPWFQPIADCIKLMAKEDIVPEHADKPIFNAVPLFAFAAVVTAFLCIPILSWWSLASFQGSLIVVLYLLAIPSLGMFVIGWSSGNPYGVVGGLRAITQLISYEVALFLALLSPAMLIGTWNISEIVRYQLYGGWWLIGACPLGFIIALIALQGKLERLPFDIPEAETEIVGGPLIEYSGRKLMLMRLVMDMQMVTCAALITALFFGGPSFGIKPEVLPTVNGYAIVYWVIGFGVFLVKTLFIVFLLAVIKTAFARLRIDQMAIFGWKWLAPLALYQFLLVTIAKFWLPTTTV